MIGTTTDFKGKGLVSENGLSKRHETRTALVISYTSHCELPIIACSQAVYDGELIVVWWRCMV